MERHAFALKIKAGKKGRFRKGLGEIWSELTVFLDYHCMKNFSIWNVEDIVFGYYETDDQFVFTEKDKREIVSLL